MMSLQDMRNCTTTTTFTPLYTSLTQMIMDLVVAGSLRKVSTLSLNSYAVDLQLEGGEDSSWDAIHVVKTNVDA